MSIRRRIILAMSANALGQAITIFSQLFLTPLFFAKWGADRYGEWLLLSTIPAYLLLADFGIGTAAANEMSIHAVAGNHAAAQRTFRGVSHICKIIALFIFGAAALFAWLAGNTDLMHLSTMTSADAMGIIVLFSLNVGLSFQLGVISAGFRCCGMNATGIFVGNMFRLLEVVGTVILLWNNQSPLAICACLLLSKLVNFVVTMLWLKNVCPWLFSPEVEPDFSLIRRLLKPSLAFLAFPLGNALALQGPILIIGLLFGPAMVAIFSAMRTLARIPYQITFVFSSSISPEMTFAFGAGNFDLLRNLHRKCWLVNAVLVSMVALVISQCGAALINTWLHKSIPFHAGLLNGLLAITFLLALWSASSMVLLSSNNHTRLAKYYLVVNGLGFAVSYLAASLTGVMGLVLALVSVEFALLLVALPLALTSSKDSLGEFLKAIFTVSAARRIFG